MPQNNEKTSSIYFIILWPRQKRTTIKKQSAKRIIYTEFVNRFYFYTSIEK